MLAAWVTQPERPNLYTLSELNLCRAMQVQCSHRKGQEIRSCQRQMPDRICRWMRKMVSEWIECTCEVINESSGHHCSCHKYYNQGAPKYVHNNAIFECYQLLCYCLSGVMWTTTAIAKMPERALVLPIGRYWQCNATWKSNSIVHMCQMSPGPLVLPSYR